jgi:hypothetical protein
MAESRSGAFGASRESAAGADPYANHIRIGGVQGVPGDEATDNLGRKGTVTESTLIDGRKTLSVTPHQEELDKPVSKPTVGGGANPAAVSKSLGEVREKWASTGDGKVPFLGNAEDMRDARSMSDDEVQQHMKHVATGAFFNTPKTKREAAAQGIDTAPDAPAEKAPKLTTRQLIQNEVAAAGKPVHKPTAVDQAHTNHIAILRGHIAKITAGKLPTGAAYDSVARANALLNKADESLKKGKEFATNRVESDGVSRRFPQAQNKQLQVAGNLILAAHDSLNQPEVLAHAGDTPPTSRGTLEAWSEHSNSLPTFSTRGKAPKSFKVFGQKFSFKDPETAMAIAEIHHEVHDLGNPHGVDPELLKSITAPTTRIAPEERDKWRVSGDELAGATITNAATSSPTRRAVDSTVDARAATAGRANVADGRPFATSTQPGRPGDSSADIAAEVRAPRAEGASPRVAKPTVINRVPKTAAAKANVDQAAAEGQSVRDTEAAQRAAETAARPAELDLLDKERREQGLPTPSTRLSPEEKQAKKDELAAREARGADVAEVQSMEKARKGVQGSMNRNERVRGGKVTRTNDADRAAKTAAQGKKKRPSRG